MAPTSFAATCLFKRHVQTPWSNTMAERDWPCIYRAQMNGQIRTHCGVTVAHAHTCTSSPRSIRTYLWAGANSQCALYALQVLVRSARAVWATATGLSVLVLLFCCVSVLLCVLLLLCVCAAATVRATATALSASAPSRGGVSARLMLPVAHTQTHTHTHHCTP